MKRILLILMILSGISSVYAQRNVTPVETDDKKPRKPSLHYYDEHGNPLNEPVMFYAELDSIREPEKKSSHNYPLLGSLSVGLNVWDAIMIAAGQNYGSFDVWADLPLHNRFAPVLELGLGMADNRPKEGNFRYKGKPSFYAKLGMNYNFMYNSDKDYQLFAGFRAGFSSFGYDIEDVEISSSYWGESNNFSIVSQRSTALYGELLLGIKVKIWRNFSMGWSFRYHFMFDCKDADNATPWYIPGYGAKNGKIAATFSLIYTIPLTKPIADEKK